MHRTDGADNVENKFTDEIPGTVVTANWLNAVQEEICGVVEGAGISLNSPSADTADQLLAAIISLIDGAVAARVLEDHPIGSVYAQFPAVGSNTESEAFPVADRPATKFGGTWTEIFTSDDAFFKVGTTDHQTRTNGKSADQFQGFVLGKSSGSLSLTNDVILSVNGSNRDSSGAADNTRRDSIFIASGSSFPPDFMNDGTNGTPRTGTKTEPENYRMKIWKRTA